MNRFDFDVIGDTPRPKLRPPENVPPAAVPGIPDATAERPVIEKEIAPGETREDAA